MTATKSTKYQIADTVFSFMNERNVENLIRTTLYMLNDTKEHFSMQDYCAAGKQLISVDDGATFCGTCRCLLGYGPIALQQTEYDLRSFANWSEYGNAMFGMSDSNSIGRFVFDARWGVSRLQAAARVIVLLMGQSKPFYELNIVNIRNNSNLKRQTPKCYERIMDKFLPNKRKKELTKILQNMLLQVNPDAEIE